MPHAASTADAKSTPRPPTGAVPPANSGSPNPGYQREVLAIRAPVAVTLAQKPVPLSVVLDLVPGAMLQFDKNCDEPLVLEVGGHAIAYGEAVKVDDKFGLRIRSFDVAKEDP
ncbi:FliM/FliN family flagellar motor C-terminal domain-containing protein [Candidatus Laterigemmans baculatus]|uniref:FliM/FliN family flagellar motor C-terminal domain-containing protein n=1 Tax=Candidatus Laterigemmans baculatus TaxID=2770505 RepID=UPI0013DD0895|nr:FliM/FliN family flagellar motor C-terminal domain-containing protein [Candidatus Laterigemmans baculatus]